MLAQFDNALHSKRQGGVRRTRRRRDKCAGKGWIRSRIDKEENMK